MPDSSKNVLESQIEVPVLMTGGQIANALYEMSDPQVFQIFSLIDEWREDIDFTLRACNVFLNELIKFHNDELEYYTEKNLQNAFLNNEESAGPLYQEDMKVAQKAIDLILKFQADYKQLTD